MAEFCLDCWNQLNEINLRKRDVILSEDLDFCEGCAEWKPVIVKYREMYLLKEWIHVHFRRKFHSY